MIAHKNEQDFFGKFNRLYFALYVSAFQIGLVGPAIGEGVLPGAKEVMLTVGVRDNSQYIFGWGAGVYQDGLVARFESNNKDILLSITGFDIDGSDEVSVTLNGQNIGALSVGPDDGLNAGNSFLLAADKQIYGINELHISSGAPNRIWGVSSLLLSNRNSPPFVSLNTPLQNSEFVYGQRVSIDAHAVDTDGAVVKVEFFVNGQKLGEDYTSPYNFEWTNAPAGAHTLSAVATDDQNSSSFSESILITVCNDVNGDQACDIGPVNNIIDAAVADMAPNTWKKINLNQFQDIWTPVALRPNSTTPSTNISGYSGAAWDSLRGKFHIWGGDIGTEEGNEVYSFDTKSGLWERGALPSAIPLEYGVTERPSVIGGVHDAPLSGESWDNVVYLENVDRLAIMGISRNSNTWKDGDGTITGPYFWDPAKADPNKVGGSDGTGVNPETLGGNMWENRDNHVTGRQTLASALHINSNGTDVVLFSDSRANLWRYTIDPIDSKLDTWKQLASRPNSGLNAGGAAAYDPVRNIYVRQGYKENTILFWDLNRESEGVFKGETVMLDPSVGRTINFRDYGMDYDPELDKLVLWNGDNKVIYIDFSDLVDADQTNIVNVRGFFKIQELAPVGMSNIFNKTTGKFTGVYGKWHYIKEKKVFIGVIDPSLGDVYIYKAGF